MGANSYVFRTDWRVRGSIEEVATILEDVEHLPDWWPSVYLGVNVIDPGGEGGVGKQVELLTKGWLPYRLRWSFTVVESNSPHGFTLKAVGDFEGTGVWTLTQEGETAHIRYDWEIVANKPLLRRLSVLLKPIFSANHEWAMQRGLESLVLELRRRRGEARVPRPPSPTFTWSHKSPAA